METIGRYQVRRVLGRGSLGVVYEVLDPSADRLVALKAITAEPLPKSALRARFLEEAQAASALGHPNIVTVLEGGEQRGKPFLAMELVPGLDLERVIRSGRRFPVEWTLDVLRQITEGLAHAHRRGLLHRDLKPADVRVTPGGEVKLLDFGIACLKSFDRLESGPARGGIFYRAPEVIEGRKADSRADAFSVGAIVYELLSGRKPFLAGDLATVMFKITHDTPDARALPATDFSPGLEAIVMKALARRREERYHSLEEMHEDLVRLVRETAPKLLRRAAPPAEKGPVSSAEKAAEGPAREASAPESEGPAAAAPAGAGAASPETERPQATEGIRVQILQARAEGHWPTALALCQRLLELEPEDEFARRTASEIEAAVQEREVEQLCGLALSYAADGEVELAAKIAEKVERVAPWSPKYLQLQVYLDEEAAKRTAPVLAATTLPSGPEPPAAAARAQAESLTSAALNHFVRNEHGQARKAVEQALALDPGDRKARELLKILGAIG